MIVGAIFGMCVWVKKKSCSPVVVVTHTAGHHFFSLVYFRVFSVWLSTVCVFLTLILIPLKVLFRLTGSLVITTFPLNPSNLDKSKYFMQAKVLYSWLMLSDTYSNYQLTRHGTMLPIWKQWFLVRTVKQYPTGTFQKHHFSRKHSSRLTPNLCMTFTVYSLT